MSVCEASTPSTATGWPVYCTLTPGHEGDHEAWGLDTIVEQWSDHTPHRAA